MDPENFGPTESRTPPKKQKSSNGSFFFFFFFFFEIKHENKKSSFPNCNSKILFLLNFPHLSLQKKKNTLQDYQHI